MRITVDDGRIVEATPISLDAARWAHERVEIDDCADEAAALARIEARLGAVHAQAEARPLAARIRLVGATPLHERLVAGRETLEQEARALGFRLAEDCWVEKLEIATRPPARARAPAAPDGLDIETLLRDAAADPGFEATLAELAELLGDKLPRGLRAEFQADPAALARLAETARDLLLGALEQEDAT